jgi:predicted ATP-grasp superfamily ATP-dependent carboligase
MKPLTTLITFSIGIEQKKSHLRHTPYVIKDKAQHLQPLAVVVGACGHGLSVIRALHAGGVRIIVLEANPRLPGVRTRLAHVELIPDINGPKLIDSLLELRTQIACKGVPVLFLTNDRMVRTVGEGWDRLEGAYKLSWSHSRNNLIPLLEKSVHEAQSLTQGLSYPHTFLLAGAKDVDLAISKIGFPMIVKPAQPLAHFKTSQPNTTEALLKLTEDFRSDLPFLVQPFIPGDDRSIYFSAAYMTQGQVLARFDGHKLRSRPLGHTTVAEACVDDEVYNQTTRFFEGLNLSGPVSLELKRDLQGTLWVIEPTVGRTDFWIDLCTENGVNLPLIEFQHQLSMPVVRPIQQNKTVWFNEDRDPFGRLWFFRQKELRMGGRSATFIFLNFNDLSPAFAALREIGGTLAKSAILRCRRLLKAPSFSLPANIQCFGPLDDFPSDIQDLFYQAENREVELGLTWLRNRALTVYANDPNVKIFVLRKNGQPTAAIPLRIVTTIFGKKIESLSDCYTALYAPAFAAALTAIDLSYLLNAIMKMNTPICSVKLAPMDPHSVSYQLLIDAMKLAGIIPFQFFCFGNWYQPIKSDWSTYFKERNGALRSTIKRMTNKLIAQGGELEVVTGGDRLEKAISAFQHVYASSWKKAEPFSQYVPGLMRACAERGWLRLGVCWLNGQPIAAQIWMVAGGKASIFKLAYDKEYRSYAPGTLLTAFLMKHSIENDMVKEVDFLVGDDSYKKSWVSDRRERWGIIAYYHRRPFGAFGLCRQILGNLFRSAFQHMKP